jgi:adenine deaminase
MSLALIKTTNAGYTGIVLMSRMPLCALLASAAILHAAQPIFIQNARVFDGVRMLPPSSVLIVGSKIEAVGSNLTAPTGSDVIDAAGMCLLPALIDPTRTSNLRRT